jgi:pyruvate dehydrogenase E2 component (dihydrolipoamide acetyltransferase)
MMSVEVRMPALSPTMEKGRLARWLVAEGDVVRPGDLIAEVETDKATMEVEAADDGRVARLMVAEGSEDVAVGAVIALLASGEDKGPIAPPPPPPASTDAANHAGQRSRPLPSMGEGGSHAPARAALSDQRPGRRPSPAERIRVSPLAARIVEAKGIDISSISGSGPNGRIVRGDLPAASRAEKYAAPAPVQRPDFPRAADIPRETIKLSPMRKAIARRLSESKQTVPHFYLTARCNIDALLRIRSDLNAHLEARGVKLSLNDLLMKAMALALIDVPEANVRFAGDELHRFSRVDLAMAVAIDGGLVTPVLQGVEALSLSAISSASKALAVKARDGKLQPVEYEGGTASISNLGMFGIDEITPVINPPHALTLGVAAGIRQPWDVNGELALATVMSVTGSFDHRAIDGAMAARFMSAFKERVEAPLLILG